MFIRSLIAVANIDVPYATQARLFNKSPSCQCGHPTEDRKHIIYLCPPWNSIRSNHLPLNHSSISMNLILSNHKSKMGLMEIMKIKFQPALQPIEDEDDPSHPTDNCSLIFKASNLQLQDFESRSHWAPSSN
ncbi:hypothetical protein CEXT_142201 [Caerostris extrusa]|uniref:Reverse transcriptase zinc-binding domain-containing protein n=1 Tax=Caerostris extrusa TaxID=172846 RepID=A0AAV4M5L4_CAEEX|nr:hypothetical protein CEXT_142201 [Caerostris extrusa]